MKLILKKYAIGIICFLLFIIVNSFSYAETPTPTPTPTPTTTPTESTSPTPSPTPDTSGLQKQIADLQGKISELQGQEKTLSSQISVMDNQMRLTQLRINSTKQQIKDLTEDIETTNKKIGSLEESLTTITKLLINRVRTTYEVGSIQPFHILLSSDGVTNFLKRLNYLKIAQANDRKIIYETQQAKTDYANEKEIFEDKRVKVESLNKELEGYNDQLDKEKQSKKILLSETQGSEENYRKLLREAQAQLAAFSGFVLRQGGASLLGNQTQCDGWGCYYNQRDGAWGASSLNGTQYTLASDGCLVTAMAMIYTHYGYRNVTPATINGISSNFASYYPAYLKFAISADGVSSQRIGAELDSILSSGHPAVVGISYDGGSIADHFVVFLSGSGGNYMMNDPFTPNGKNISFRDRYPTERIVQVNKVLF